MAAEKTNKTQPESAEQGGFLGVIDAKIAALQKLRESFVAAASVGAMAEASDMAAMMNAGSLGGSVGGSIELPRGALLNKSIPAAIKLYLAAVKKKQTIKEIAAALKEGGVETTAKNFETPVTTAINRLKAAGDVLRFTDGWALTEFYPESLRNRMEKSARDRAKPSTKRSKVKTAARSQKRKTEARGRPKATVARNVKAVDHREPKIVGLEQRIVAYLQTRGQEFTTDQEVAAQLKVENLQVLRMTLGKMVKQERIEKHTDGRVRLIKKAA